MLRVQTSVGIDAPAGAELFACVAPEHCRVLSEEVAPAASVELTARSEATGDVPIAQPYAGMA
jgi:hypothetical protein